MSKHLKSAVEIASVRAAKIAGAALRREREETRRAEWAKRLDPAAYQCRREGNAWIAEGPAGQRFEYRRGIEWGDGHYDVNVVSASGGEYVISTHHNLCACTCPAAAKDGGCKHISGYLAVRMAAKMDRAARQASAAADADRKARAEKARNEIASVFGR